MRLTNVSYEGDDVTFAIARNFTNYEETNFMDKFMREGDKEGSQSIVFMTIRGEIYVFQDGKFVVEAETKPYIPTEFAIYRMYINTATGLVEWKVLND